MGKSGQSRGRLKAVRGFISELYGHDLHAKRVEALAGATLGVMTGASLAVAVIGQALAQARGLVTKHAIKQVDRLMSNAGIDVWDSFARWVPHQIGARRDILVAMDWTDFDRDGQSTLVLSLATGHGRAAPLLWLSVWKDEIASRRNDYEDACLCRLAETLPPDRRVTILADRGFGDQKLFGFLAELGFGYVIRFRGNIGVIDAAGESRPAAKAAATVISNPPVASSTIKSGAKSRSSPMSNIRPLSLRATAKARPDGRTWTSRQSFETSIPTKRDEVGSCSMTRPCECGLALRPRRLFGLPLEPVDGAPCSFAGSFTRGEYGLPSTNSLTGFVSAGNWKIQGDE